MVNFLQFNLSHNYGFVVTIIQRNIEVKRKLLICSTNVLLIQLLKKIGNNIYLRVIWSVG